jgi:hypothetical protein
VTSVEDDENV